MRVRVLYPSGVNGALREEHEAGAVINIDDALAAGLIRDGSVEEVPRQVERATAAPGEKRTVRKKKA